MTAESDDSPALIETPPQQPRGSALFVVEESPSIFEWRGFFVSKKIIHFRCDADAIGMAETAMHPSFAVPSRFLERHSNQSPIPQSYYPGPVRKSLASTSSNAVIAPRNSARKASA